MIDPAQISNLIERMVAARKISYMEAVIEVCEEHSVDASMVARHLSKPIIENIEREAMEVNLLPKRKSLPFA
jgi:phosphoribosylformylglycinamidine (FGAM) synthase-like enzyme